MQDYYGGGEEGGYDNGGMWQQIPEDTGSRGGDGAGSLRNVLRGAVDGMIENLNEKGGFGWSPFAGEHRGGGCEAAAGDQENRQVGGSIMGERGKGEGQAGVDDLMEESEGEIGGRKLTAGLESGGGAAGSIDSSTHLDRGMRDKKRDGGGTKHGSVQTAHEAASGKSAEAGGKVKEIGRVLGKKEERCLAQPIFHPNIFSLQS